MYGKDKGFAAFTANLMLFGHKESKWQTVKNE
jgi:hypothetical protein